MITLANREKDLRNAAARSLRDTRRDFDKRIDEIRAELEAIGPEAAEKVGRSLNDLRADLKDDLQSGFDDVNGRFEDEVESGRKQVREHPLLAVGVAVMAGVIVGMLLGKNKD
jgi:ElaB/YqjD/DUF883 family membrane-anchored ribosome-binding protein